jgi:hypothetical protein
MLRREEYVLRQKLADEVSGAGAVSVIRTHPNR